MRRSRFRGQYIGSEDLLAMLGRNRWYIFHREREVGLFDMRLEEISEDSGDGFLLWRLSPANAFFEYLWPEPNMKLFSEEQLPCFSDNAWEGHKADPPPRREEPQNIPFREASRVKAFRSGKDPRDKL